MLKTVKAYQKNINFKTFVRVELDSTLNLVSICYNQKDVVRVAVKHGFCISLTSKILAKTCTFTMEMGNDVIRPLQKRERAGKEYGCFPFVCKSKIIE